MSDSLILEKRTTYPGEPEILRYISPKTKHVYKVNQQNCYVPGVEYKQRKDHSTHANLLLQEVSRGHISGIDYQNTTLTLLVHQPDTGTGDRPFTLGINETFAQFCMDLKADKLSLQYQDLFSPNGEVMTSIATLEIDEDNIVSALRIAKENKCCTLVAHAAKIDAHVPNYDAHRSTKVPGPVARYPTPRVKLPGWMIREKALLGVSDSDSESEACDTPATTSTTDTVIGVSHSMENNTLFASRTSIASRKDHTTLAKQLLEMVANQSLSIDDYNKLTMPIAVHFALESKAEVFVIGINETSDSLHTALAARKLYFSHHDPSMVASVYQEVTEDNVRGLLRFAKQYERCSLRIIKGLGA